VTVSPTIQEERKRKKEKRGLRALDPERKRRKKKSILVARSPPGDTHVVQERGNKDPAPER